MSIENTKFLPSVVLLAGLLAPASLTVQAASPPGMPHVSISVQSQPPSGAAVNLTPPAVAQEGATAILTAEGQGSGPLQFQWFMNGAIIEGATNAVHILETLERADDGIYSILVTNSAGRATSAPTRLLISNLKPARYMGLSASSPTGGVPAIQYADSLATNALWTPLTGVTSSVAPLVIVDTGSTNASQRFYKTPRTNTLAGRLMPGWGYLDPTGSVHTIEFIDPQAGSTNWQPLQTITLAQSPSLFADTTATNTSSRRYRSTMVESPAARRVGRLAYAVRWILPPDVYTNVVQTNRTALTSLGIFLDDAEHALQMPTNVLGGYWVVLGDQRVMTDTNGNFSIDVPYGAANGFVVPRRGDRSTYAEAIFQVSQLALPGQAPTPILVRYEYEGALNMDGPSLLSPAGLPVIRPADVICGNPGVHVGNTIPCCLDYNGYISTDCKDTTGGLDATRVLHYVGSTCYRLVNEGLCFREYNSHAVGFRVPGLTCFVNHKYRNCQNVDLNLDTAFTLSASATTVTCGQSLNLTIHNNSRANETEFSLGPPSRMKPGTLSGTRVSAGSSPQSYTLRHYDDALRAHYSDGVIQYKAPKPEEMPPGVDEMIIQVRARAAGVERMVEITVKCGCADNPSVMPIPHMVSIPAGTFTMGSPASEPARYSSEGPQTLVTISRGFCMGKYEVTQAEYLSVMGSNPSYFTGDLNRPVEQVSWNDCVAYCTALTTRERNAGRLPAGYGYRLPTEAEWEYACRAGTSTAFHYGDALRSGMGNFYGYYEYPPCAGQAFPYGCYNPSGTYLGRTTSVGSYAPNAWGLYDMHGNVWEWCSDWWSSNLPGGSVSDPQGALTGSYRVVRGGSWGGYAFDCRSAGRSFGSPGAGSYSAVGFRVVLAPGQP